MKRKRSVGGGIWKHGLRKAREDKEEGKDGEKWEDEERKERMREGVERETVEGRKEGSGEGSL